MKKNGQKPYWEMNAKELATATKVFDGSLPRSKTKPLSAGEREHLAGVRARIKEMIPPLLEGIGGGLAGDPFRNPNS